MKINSGFTLIELMITVAIIGILSAIAIPMYSDYVTRSRIPQATSQLSARATKMEQFFQDNHTYVGADGVADICGGADTYFSYGCSSTDTYANTYTITATGQGPMADFVYKITETGTGTTKSSSGPWGSQSSCWITNKGGAC